MAQNKKTEKKTLEKKRKAVFTVGALLLASVVIISIVMYGLSSFIHGESAQKLNESLYPKKYDLYVETYAKKYNVDVCLVYGVIRTESGFDPDAVSPVGAIGLMQIMPETFTWLQNYRTDFMPDTLLDSSELYKPKVNIEYGTYLLKYLLDRYGGDTSLAIIAYNAGHGNVDKWLEDGTVPQSGVTSEDIPFTETANYLTRVTNSMDMYRKLYFSDEQTDTSSLTLAQIEGRTQSGESQPDSEPAQSDYSEESSSSYEYDQYAFEGDGTGMGYSDENYDYSYNESYEYEDNGNEDYAEW